MAKEYSVKGVNEGSYQKQEVTATPLHRYKLLIFAENKLVRFKKRNFY